MSTIRVNRTAYTKIKQSELAVFAANVSDRLSSQPGYEAFQEKAVALEKQVQIYHSALSGAVSGGKDRTAIKLQARKVLIDILHQIAREMDIHFVDRPERITSAGMSFRYSENYLNAKVVIPTPFSVMASRTLTKGEVLVQFNIAPNRIVRLFIIEFSADNGLTWPYQFYSTKKKATFNNLPTGVPLRVRVMATGAYRRKSSWVETEVSDE